MMSYSRCRVLTLLLLQASSHLVVLGTNASVVSTGAEPSGASGPDYTGPSAGSDECDPEMVGFELVTGYVYTAPTNILESIPGTLMLTDCLETCQANDSCQAVNYETGLCVLFSSNADNNPGKIESYPASTGKPIAIYLFIPSLIFLRDRLFVFPSFRVRDRSGKIAMDRSLCSTTAVSPSPFDPPWIESNIRVRIPRTLARSNDGS